MQINEASGESGGKSIVSKKSYAFSDYEVEDDDADFYKDDEDFLLSKKKAKKKTKEQNKPNKPSGPGALLKCNTKRR